eukprot:jgi/Botrbrau1/3443/Bobra.139_1s0023.1
MFLCFHVMLCCEWCVAKLCGKVKTKCARTQVSTSVFVDGTSGAASLWLLFDVALEGPCRMAYVKRTPAVRLVSTRVLPYGLHVEGPAVRVVPEGSCCTAFT